MEVRVASPADAGDIATLFAAAFQDDPWLGWTFPDRTARPHQLTAFMARLVDQAIAAGWVLIGAGGATAALWHPPEGVDGGEAGAHRRFLRGLIGDHAAAVLAAGAEVASLRARFAPHFYLSVIATDPARRGHRFGRRLLHESLERIDARAGDAYLESTNPANVPFYEDLGFAAVGAVRAPAGPTLTAMHRPGSMSR